MTSPADHGRPDADQLAEELDEPTAAAPPAHDPGKQTGATASERASAQTAAELSER